MRHIAVIPVKSINYHRVRTKIERDKNSTYFSGTNVDVRVDSLT